MGNLHTGDENLHHCDTSHRWTAPPDVDQQLWVAVVRDHLEEHRKTMGGPAKVTERRPVCSPFAGDPGNRGRGANDRIPRPAPALVRGRR